MHKLALRYAVSLLTTVGCYGLTEVYRECLDKRPRGMTAYKFTLLVALACIVLPFGRGGSYA